jgi:hypothetical protein
LGTDPAANANAANALIDAAVQRVAQAQGITVGLPNAGGAAGSAVVDSAALDAFAQQVTGSDGVLAATARFVLNELGVAAPAVAPSEDANAAVVTAVEAELGADWPKQVEPRFDERRALLLDDRWASAREDLARLYYGNTNGGDDESIAALNFIGAGQDVSTQARWFAGKAQADGNEELSATFARIAEQALEPLSDDPQSSRFASDVAIVTWRRREFDWRTGRQRPAGWRRDGYCDLAQLHHGDEGMGQAHVPQPCGRQRQALAGSREPVELPRCRCARAVGRLGQQKRRPAPPPRFSNPRTSRRCSSPSPRLRCTAPWPIRASCSNRSPA